MDFDGSDKEHLRERGLGELDWYDKNGQATEIALIAAGHLRPADKSHPTRHIIHIKPEERTASEKETLDRILDHRAASGALILNGGRLGRIDGKKWSDIAIRNGRKKGIKISAVMAAFHGEANFAFAEFNGLSNFWMAQFRAAARFEYTVFNGPAYFSNAHFHGEARFGSAGFYGLGAADFARTDFLGQADFTKGLFCVDALFGSAHFHGRADFTKRQFSKKVSFWNSHFHGQASFNDGEFSRSIEFGQAWFGKLATFSACTFPPLVSDSRHAFRGARFRDAAFFDLEKLHNLGMFEGTNFQNNVLIDHADIRTTEVNIKNAIKAAKSSADSEFEDNNYPMDFSRAELRDRYYKSLEEGCKTLLNVALGNRDHALAQRYFRYMLKAREAQTVTTTADFVERVACKAFGLFSDYGAGIARPLLWAMVALPLLVAMAYLAMLHGLAPNIWWTDLSQALEAAYTNTFRPFVFWDVRLVKTYDSTHLIQEIFAKKNNQDSNWRGWSLMVSTFQSFLTLACLFLFGLGVRRKFQMR